MMPSKEDWEKQYTEGKWNHLDTLEESGRYAIIGLYCNWFHKQPDVLDVGCGTGIITNYIKFKNFLGIDISEDAIQKANKKENCAFLATNAEEFRTDKKFDVIIFNEILYYLDAIKIMKKYEEFLNPEGIFVISIWENPRTKLVWDLIEFEYDCKDYIQVVNKKTDNKWHVGIFKTKQL